jgi:hypothetical protein
MATEFDRYREALVIENHTVWPPEYDAYDAAARSRVEHALHAEPAKAAELRYDRLHSGFARVITVTDDDLARIK